MRLFNRKKLRELLAEYKQVRRLQAYELEKHLKHEPYAKVLSRHTNRLGRITGDSEIDYM